MEVRIIIWFGCDPAGKALFFSIGLRVPLTPSILRDQGLSQ